MGEINLKINLSYGDGEYMSAEVARDTLLWQFICWGIFLPVVALVGLVGNALTIVVLWRKEMHSTTILYMRGLVITDTGILLSAAIVLTPFACANYLHNDALRHFNENVYPIIYTPINFVVMTLQACNVWVTVSVSVERYIAICHPFRAARLCTRRKTLIVIASICLISVIYNIPRLFASYARQCNEVEEVSGSSCYYLADTDFGRSYLYKTVYFSILYTLIIFVIPLAALFILNVFLIQELMRMQRRRTGTNIHDENEANLSLVLVLIVVVFIFCQSPGLVAQFDIYDFGTFLKWLAVSNLLFVINSAVNFLIYTAFGSKFRKVLLRVFRRLYGGPRSLSLRGSLATTNGYELTAVQDQTLVLDTLDREATTPRVPSYNDLRSPPPAYQPPVFPAGVKDKERAPVVAIPALGADSGFCSSDGGPSSCPLTKSGSSDSLKKEGSPLTKNTSSDISKNERSPLTKTSSSDSLKNERSPLTKNDSVDSLDSLKNVRSPLTKHYSVDGLKTRNDSAVCLMEDETALVKSCSCNSLKADKLPLLQNGDSPSLAHNGSSESLRSDKLTSSKQNGSGSSISLTNKKTLLTKRKASSSDSLKSDKSPLVKNGSAGSLHKSEKLALVKNHSSDCLRLQNSEWTPLTKCVSSESLKRDRVPGLKVVTGNGVQENGVKGDRYPLNNNCVAVNGPKPADV